MKARAVRGTALSMVGFGGSQVLRLASNLILTRILFPEVFGLMALVQVVLIGLEMFSDMGLRPAIIQSKRGDDPVFLNTAWTLQIIRGAILWVFACLLTVPVARFYGHDELLQMIPVLSLTMVISGFSSTRLIQANRNLYLGPQIITGLTSQFGATVVMILLAFWTKSVWALVFGSLFGACLKAGLSHIIVGRPRNQLVWEKEAFHELFHFGKYIFVATIASYFVSQGSRLILGKLVTLEELAIFVIAFFLANVPVKLNRVLVERILMPLYRTRPPAESEANRRQIGRARLLLVGGFIAIAIFVSLIGNFTIDLLYDPRYISAGPMLVLLGLSVLPGLMLGGYKQILLANGNSRHFTFFNICSALLQILILFFMINKFGVVGAIVAPFLVDIVTYPLLVYLIRPYRGWYPLQDVMFTVVGILFGAIALWNSPSAMQMLAVIQF